MNQQLVRAISPADRAGPVGAADVPSLSHEEMVSSLADGQLHGELLGAALKACGESAEAGDCWATYHLIGDVLRSPGAPVRAADAGFVSRFSARLAQETAIVVMPVVPDAPPIAVLVPAPAANDPLFRWKLAAGFASLAAVSVIAWSLSGSLVAPSNAPQLAQATPSVPSTESPQIIVASPQGPIVRDARLEELLAAHRQVGGGSALEAPSGFLRNAAFETSAVAGR